MRQLTQVIKACILESMAQPTIFSAVRWSVADLTRHIRERLDSDEMLQDAWVMGEISNLSRPASGHVYLTLKDASAALRCVIWRSVATTLRTALQDGMAVDAHGHISVYEAGGQYQLYIDQIQPAGEGALYQEFLRLKGLLEAEGLFDPGRKRPIPELPRSIGVVTSASGAAWRDILNTLRRRQPLLKVILAHASVQGADAPASLIEALIKINRLQPDVILLARGGGSIEDLWAFNDERLVRAVAASKAPVICGVGHETDFTLCDFAADLRAPTPTASAELATQVTVDDLANYLLDTRRQLSTWISEWLGRATEGVHTHLAQLRLVSPEHRLRSELQRMDDMMRRLSSSVIHFLAIHELKKAGLDERLDSLNPAAVLSRGYAILTRKSDGRIVARIQQATKEMIARVSDGEFEVMKT